MSNVDQIAEARAKAAHALKMAESASPGVRQTYLRTAAGWKRLADDLERKAGIKKSSEPGSL